MMGKQHSPTSTGLLPIILCLLVFDTAETGLVNVAVGKPCSASSQYSGGYNTGCDKANNNNLSRVYSSDNCIHTGNGDTTPSWTVDLEEDYSIHQIVIYFRDGYPERMTSTAVSIDGHTVFLTADRNVRAVTAITDNLPRTGRRVKISRHSSGGNRNYVLNICEVQVKVCTEGTYGDVCTLTCGAGCEGGTCDDVNGHCTCKPGWELGTCQRCGRRWYGADCNSTCSNLCRMNFTSSIDRECHITNGRCLFGCVEGYFGSTCDQRCSSLHCEGGCDQDSGACVQGCVEGYFGPFCNNTCSKQCASVSDGSACDDFDGHCYNGCHEGAYGDRCDQPCGDHCEGACDRVTGHCPVCRPGYYGLYCDSPCGNGCRFGDCDDSTGNCSCLPGWASGMCADCEDGQYGNNCENQCGHCNGTMACNRTTGICQACQPGWQPPLCQQACLDGRWGDNCAEMCGRCVGQAVCDKVTGRCSVECDPGYLPPLCRTACDDGRYGQDCKSTCGNCGDNHTCDKVTGTCDTCLPGYLLPFCTTSSDSVSVRWTSDSHLPNNVIISACPSQNVTLDWKYVIPSPDVQVMITEWLVTHEGMHDRILATEVRHRFFPSPTTTSIQQVSNAGIRLINVSVEDTGTYSVDVRLNAQGSILTNVQSAYVLVSLDNVTEDGELHVRMEPGSVVLPTTNMSHVLLSCGKFRSHWAAGVNVLWTVQSTDETVKSTFYRDGRFYLALDNPLTTDNYTCSLDPASPASHCVRPDSSIITGVTFYVDAKTATINLLTGQLQRAREEIATLTGDNSQLLDDYGRCMEKLVNNTAAFDSL